MRFRTFLLLSLLFAWSGKVGKAQGTVINADCQIPFSIDATTAPANVPSTSGFNNATKQCGTWILAYEAPTTVSAIQIVLQSASDTAGSPGTFGTFSGTTIVGSNPSMTVPNAQFASQGNPAWVRVHLTSATGTGTIKGSAYGWIVPPQVYTSGSGGGPTANVNVAQYGGTNTTLGQKAMVASMPVVIASDQSPVPVTPSGTQDVNLKQVNGHTVLEGGANGGQGVGGLAGATASAVGNPVRIGGKDESGNIQDVKVDTQGNQYAFDACPNSVITTLSGTGYNTVVPGTSSQVIRVCKIVLLSASAGSPALNTFSIATGTCAGSPSELVNYPAVTGIAEDYGGSLRTGSGQSLCISESTANSDKVTVFYAKAAF